MTSNSVNGSGVEAVRKHLAAIRSSLATKKAERAKVFAAPVPKPEALAALERVMESMASTFRADVLNLPALTRHTQDPADFRLFRSYGLGEDLSDRAASGLLWLVLGPAIRKTVEAELDAWYATAGKPMTKRERAAALEALVKEIGALESQERELLDALSQIAA